MISLAVAHDLNRVIGSGGCLPWQLLADLRHFRRLSMGKHVLMGRRTYQSLPCELDGRAVTVLTSDPDWLPEQLPRRRGGMPSALGVVRGDPVDLGSLLASAARVGEDVMVAGGAAVYEAALPHVEVIYRTLVLACYAGDAYFPALGPDWDITSRRDYPAVDGMPPFAFETLHRR